ncbi:hypothetical protein [Pseudohaliea rubra]|uniref:Uncharacterized protein n=1 Tax=Pseudohaliea rubra DSM 19751 TaxID=1265313 RepID=A0A095VT61_9GAMM|nr:hypothetical protein [Pseudohaliea rubra]KGE04617.1 hypothetical protein HRUBRA_00776 [Pseudohaliea rubra DSM 19751]
MSDDHSNPDPELISPEEQEQDSRIGAKMHLFLERMIRAAMEEEGIEAERAQDLMLCTAVQLYTERSSVSARELGVFCKAIAEEVLENGSAEGTVH